MKAIQAVKVIQVGIGTVGGEVVRQLLAGRARWRDLFGFDVAVAAVVWRGGALVAEGEELPPAVLEAAVAGRATGAAPADLAGDGGVVVGDARAAIEAIAGRGATILVDAATGDQTADLDVLALSLGAGVVLSNKAPLAKPWAAPQSRQLWAEAGAGGRLRYEATCGAGLPVFSTLRGLLDTGDEVREVLGALSGTLGAIFSDVESGRAFSVAVQAAVDQGYTEPDPRDDLSGLDVARKALILARTLGRSDDLGEMKIEGLVPAHLAADAGVSVATFLERSGELDAAMAKRAKEAETAGQVLRYVATVRPDEPPVVGIRAVPAASVLGALRGPENAVSFRTARYDAFPLGVSGPGAGPAVTAAGMIGDLLALATGSLRAVQS